MKGVGFIVARAWMELSARVLEKREGGVRARAARTMTGSVDKPKVFVSDTPRAGFRNSQRRA